jgi:hypothetical protein
MQMKICFIYKILSFVLVSVLIACTRQFDCVYFTIDPNDRKIVLPVVLNDSITANMLFDTAGNLVLDSSFAVAHPSLVPGIVPIEGLLGSAWSDLSEHRPSLFYNHIIQTIKVGNTNITYKSLAVTNWINEFDTTDKNGIFNIPADDTTHVWELNFEHNYLKIHLAETFQMPEKSFLCPMVITSHKFYIQIPMQIKYIDDDTLTNNNIYVIDTGMPHDIVFMHPTSEESEFLDKHIENAVWTEFSSGKGYHLRHIVNATLFDNFNIDSLRIYTFNISRQTNFKYSYLVGINFLKRFNVFFDMKNQQVGLVPLKKFQRVVQPNHRRFCFLSHPTPDGYVVDMVPNYKDNYYRNAGLQEGDEVIVTNGKRIKDLTYKEKVELSKEINKIDTFILDIIRNGKPMQLIIPVDKNLENGD